MFAIPTMSLSCSSALAFLLCACLWIALRRTVLSPLKNVPGPFWAKLSGLYRVNLVWDGACGPKTETLHRRYGPLVRTGPKHVLFSDPEALHAVYDSRTKFVKAGKNSLDEDFDAVANEYRVDSTVSLPFVTKVLLRIQSFRQEIHNIISF